MKSTVSAAAAGLLCLLAGCSSVLSHRVDEKSHQVGVSYYLPKRMVRATFERVKLVEDPTAKLAGAQQALTDGEREAAAAEAHLAQTAAKMKSLQAAGVEATAAIFVAALGENVNAALKAETARAAVTESKRKRDALAAAKLEWDLYKNQCGYVDRFSVTVLPPIPDLTQSYVLEPRHSPTRTENFRIKTTTSGLLSTVEGSIEDQSAAIVVALAQGAAAWHQAPPQALGNRLGLFIKNDGKPDACSDWKPRRIESVLDPLSQWTSFVDAINADLASCGADCRLPEYAVTTHLDAPSVKEVVHQPRGTGGVFYRRERPLVVNVTKREAGVTLPAGSFLLALPNDAPPELLPMHSSPFVTTRYDVGFDQGLLVSVDSNRPSEALRIASLPWDVAQATMDVLTSLIRFRVDYTKSDVDLLNQQIEQIKQQQALLEARQRAESPPGNAYGSSTPNP